MQQSVPPDIVEVFTELAGVVYSGALPQEALDTVVRVTAQVVPGADHVSISTLDSGSQLRTQAATDDIARLMDQLESEAGEGPCLDSILEESVQRDDDIAVSTAWPALAKLTLERTPVRGMLGYQLMNGSDGRAALNVFSDTPGALTQEAADIGALLAAFTSVTLTAVDARASAETLREGLMSNREIGKAIGLLMAAHDVDDAEAFEILRVTSNATNVRIADLAARITQSRKHAED